MIAEETAAVQAPPKVPAKGQASNQKVVGEAPAKREERPPVHTNSKPSTLVLRKRVGTPKKIPEGRNIVIYKGGNECKSLALDGIVTDSGYTTTHFDTGHKAKYVFDRMDPETGQRWDYCDHPGHLTFFRTHANPDGGPLFSLKVTPEMLEKMNRFRGRYNVDAKTGAMQPRNDPEQTWAEEIEMN